MHHISSWAAGRTHIQILQTVPAEGVFAALTQHLGTALVPLNVDTAHWTLFDERVGVVVSADPVTGKISQNTVCIHILRTALLAFSWNNASGHLTNVKCQFLSSADLSSN